MATITLILGESGTGKTTSLRNFKSGEVAIVNAAGKPLPFKGKFETLNGDIDFRHIVQFCENTTAKRIVIDDCQYIMSFQYMRRIKENGWDKFNEIQSDFFNLIEFAKSLPEDVTVYFLSHLENKDDGRQKIKTIGKMLDEKITIEGMFTTVLKTHVSDGKYFFLTQNSGMDTTKSPLGMFPTFAIDNDLKYVDDKIRNYYEIGEFKSDEEIAMADKQAEVTEVEKGSNGRVKRATRATREEKPSETARDPQINIEEAIEQTTKEEVNAPQNEPEQPRQRRQRKQRNEDFEINDEDCPF